MLVRLYLTDWSVKTVPAPTGLATVWQRDPRAPRAGAARRPRQLPDRRQRPCAAAAARDRELVGDVGARRAAAQQALHADRARPHGPRPVGHAARRLLAGRPRQRGARHRHGARPRARDRRRALARRRHRDAVRLPVPGAHGSPRARLQRRARPRGALRPAGRLAAGRRLRAARAHLAPAARARAPGRRPAGARRAAARRRHRGARPRLRGARQRGLAPGVPAHGPGRDRARRPARERAEPAPPRRPAADADRVGRERLDHPVRHGEAAHEAMPGSHFVSFERSGHMPHDDDPYRFAQLLTEFCDDQRRRTPHRRPLAAAGRREAH